MRLHLALLAFVLVACDQSAAEAPKPTSPYDRDTMLIHMHANFDLVRAIEQLLIRGKLDDARVLAHAIATAPDEGPKHGNWATHAIQVRARASAIERAPNTRTAIREVAELGGECGNCHADVGASPQFARYPSLPPDGPAIEQRMARHRWAADRIWEGIVGNQDAAWQAGLEVLAEPPPDLSPAQAPYGRQLQRLASQARHPSTGLLTPRATTYGEILNLCASCHATR